MDNTSPYQPAGNEFLVYRRHPVNLLGPFTLTLVVVLVMVVFVMITISAELLPMPESLPYIILYMGVLIFLAINFFFMYWTFWSAFGTSLYPE